ncbi:Discoidin-1 subunit A [Diplonema papillatum]|nr:Discoidin-1 subunit A [Diplonema papillatum]
MSHARLSAVVDALSMDDLPPSAFSSSGPPAAPASHARLHFPFDAWVARTTAPGEYLQVDLPACFVVTAVATQGHPAEPWWVSSFRLQYSPDRAQYFEYNDGSFFEGNRDPQAVVEHTLVPPLAAASVRVLCLACSGKFALRVGLKGYRKKGPDAAGHGALISSLRDDFRRLVNADGLADVALVVRAGNEQRTLLAHKLVLSSRSAFLASALQDAAEQQGCPNVTRLVIDDVVAPGPQLPAAVAVEMSCQIILHILRFLYAGDAPPAEHLYAVSRAAHQLELDPLANLCEEVLHQRATSLETCVESFVLADRESSALLRQAALETIVAHWNSLDLDWGVLSRDQILAIVSEQERRKNGTSRRARLGLP